MTSGKTLPNGARFLEIDESNIGDHYNLNLDDRCYFLFEYTSGRNYSFSQTNNLISNLKKKPSRRGLPEYRYKRIAIKGCSRWIARALNHHWLSTATLVPVPPSKAKDHPEYDDRVLQICEGLPVDFPVGVRELVTQTASLEAAHESADRPTIDNLLDVYQIDEDLTDPAPTFLAIIDDVLTAGTHFRAMERVLSGRFPSVPIVGLFVARRVFPPDDNIEDEF